MAELVAGRALDYFRLAEGTSSDTWKLPAAGGPVERVTREGSASFAVESMDGKDLIHKRNDEDSPLLALPIGGGPVRQLLPCVHGVNFAVGLAGSTTRPVVRGRSGRFTSSTERHETGCLEVFATSRLTSSTAWRFRPMARPS